MGVSLQYRLSTSVTTLQNPSQSFVAFVDRKVAKKEVLALAV